MHGEGTTAREPVHPLCAGEKSCPGGPGGCSLLLLAGAQSLAQGRQRPRSRSVPLPSRDRQQQREGRESTGIYRRVRPQGTSPDRRPTLSCARVRTWCKERPSLKRHQVSSTTQGLAAPGPRTHVRPAMGERAALEERTVRLPTQRTGFPP